MIKELLDEEIIGYGCIITGARKNDEYVKRTKAYEKLTETFSQKMMNPDNVLIDVTNSHRDRKKFLEIIDTFKAASKKDPIKRSNPCGNIVITNISALGTTPKEIVENFTLLCDSDIGILIFDNDDFSTVDYGWEYCKTPTMVKEIIEQIKDINVDEDIKTNQGRKKKPLIVTPEFKELYWLFENYFLAEKNIYKNKIIGKITKVAFNQLCDIYEQSEEYPLDEQIENERNNLVVKPKRHGVVPSYFPELVRLIDNGSSIPDACKQLTLPEMTEITFARYVIKYKTGRSGTGKATHKYYVPWLNEEIKTRLEVKQ